MSRRPLIAPSILSADFAALGEAVARIEDAADLIHFDVMDGHFVPNITVGPPVVEALKRRTRLPLDVHLMIAQPERYLADFARAGAAYITVHAEACIHLHRALQQIHELGLRAGVAINPATPIAAIEHVLRDADLVLLMSVNPGFGGQSFIPFVLDKIAELRRRLDACGSRAELEVDGGVKPDNCRQVVQAGATILVAGSAIFGTADPRAATLALRDAAAEAAGGRG
jgi:ribulose-phosphate 3-epimerase